MRIKNKPNEVHHQQTRTAVRSSPSTDAPLSFGTKVLLQTIHSQVLGFIIINEITVIIIAIIIVIIINL